MKIRKKLIVKGIVQGVGLRGYSRDIAKDFGIEKGYAENFPDGTVIVFLEGSISQINSFIEKLKKFSGVEKIEVLDYEKEIDSEGHYYKFE